MIKSEYDVETYLYILNIAMNSSYDASVSW